MRRRLEKFFDKFQKLLEDYNDQGWQIVIIKAQLFLHQPKETSDMIFVDTGAWFTRDPHAIPAKRALPQACRKCLTDFGIDTHLPLSAPREETRLLNGEKIAPKSA